MTESKGIEGEALTKLEYMLLAWERNQNVMLFETNDAEIALDFIKEWVNARIAAGRQGGDTADHPAAPGVAPVAWIAEYDGHTAVTTNRDTMAQWRDTLGRKIKPLYASPSDVRQATIEEAHKWQTARVSIDVSTCDDDAGHRVFGRVVDWQPFDDAGEITLLCDYESDNFGMRSPSDVRLAMIEECAKVADQYVVPHDLTMQSSIQRGLASEMASAIRSLASKGKTHE